VLVASATQEAGVPELADAIEQHRETARRPERARERAGNQVRRALAVLAARRAEAGGDWEGLIGEVAERRLDPLTAAERLLAPDR
jgi:putative protein kinase ArgK-like GTPase of G3E family